MPAVPASRCKCCLGTSWKWLTLALVPPWTHVDSQPTKFHTTHWLYKVYCILIFIKYCFLHFIPTGNHTKCAPCDINQTTTLSKSLFVWPPRTWLCIKLPEQQFEWINVTWTRSDKNTVLSCSLRTCLIWLTLVCVPGLRAATIG